MDESHPYYRLFTNQDSLLPKLIRDDMVKRIEADGFVATVSERPDDLPTLLFAKLLEELAELKAAESTGDRIEELADLLSVLMALTDEMGIDWLADVVQAEERKTDERGGFTRGLVLEGIQEPADALKARIFGTPTVTEAVDLWIAYCAGGGPLMSKVFDQQSDLFLGAAVAEAIDAADERGFRLGRVLQDMPESDRVEAAGRVRAAIPIPSGPDRWDSVWTEYCERRGNPPLEAMPEPEPLEVDWDE